MDKIQGEKRSQLDGADLFLAFLPPIIGISRNAFTHIKESKIKRDCQKFVKNYIIHIKYNIL